MTRVFLGNDADMSPSDENNKPFTGRDFLGCLLAFFAFLVVAAAICVPLAMLQNSCRNREIESLRAYDTQYLVDLPHKSDIVLYVLHQRAENGDDLAIVGIVDTLRVSASSERTQQAALEDLSGLGDRAIPALVGALEHEEDFEASYYVVIDGSNWTPDPMAILMYKGESAVGPLMDAAKNTQNSADMRARCIKTLGDIGDNRANDVVSSLLDAQEWPIRCEAIVALYHMGSDSYVAMAKQSLMQESLANIAGRYESFAGVCNNADVCTIMCSVLATNGTKAMAEWYINDSGYCCSDADAAARNWAANHGYTVESVYHEYSSGWLRKTYYYTFQLTAK